MSDLMAAIQGLLILIIGLLTAFYHWFNEFWRQSVGFDTVVAAFLGAITFLLHNVNSELRQIRTLLSQRNRD